MASTGTAKTNSYDGRYIKVDWTQKEERPDLNMSVISYTISAVGGNSSWYNTGPVRVTINTNNGATHGLFYQSGRKKMYAGEIASGSFAVRHKTNGSLTITIEIEAAIYSSAINCTATKSFALDPIPQTPTAPTTVTATAGNGNYVSIGDTATIRWSGASGVITGYQWAYRWYRKGSWEDWSASKSVSTTATSGSATQGVTSTAAFAGDRLQFRVRAMNGSLASAWVSSNSLTVVGGMRINIRGAWDQGLAFVNVNGTWKRAQHVYVKVNGVWKEST